MKKFHFENFEEFVSEVLCKCQNNRELDEYSDVSIIAKFEEAKEIVAHCICMDCDPYAIELIHPEFNNYHDEYIISITNIDGHDSVFCEPMFVNGKYLNSESSINYVMDNCSSKVLKHCTDGVTIEVCVGLEETCNDVTSQDSSTSESVHISRNESGVPLGFSKTWSTNKNGLNCYSSYSHYSDDLELLKSIASEFGVDL